MICRSYDLHHKKSTIYLIFLKGLNIILFLINKLLFFKRGFLWIYSFFLYSSIFLNWLYEFFRLRSCSDTILLLFSLRFPLIRAFS